jgi:CRP-like cAMP-binding protein
VPRSLDQLLDLTPWTGHLEAGQLERVRVELTEREVPAGGYVCRKGGSIEHWFGVIDGLVKISSGSPDGKSVTFIGVPTGGWFGEGSMLKDEPRRYDAVALRTSRIACMPRATFQWLLDTSIPFNRHLLGQLNERLGQFVSTMEVDRLQGPDARVAHCLAQMFNRLLYPNPSRRLDISQAELGYLTGLSRQRVNQALQAIERAGLVTVDYGSITVLSLEGLREFEG